MAFPSLTVPETQSSLRGQADQGCLLLPDSAKVGGVTFPPRALPAWMARPGRSPAQLFVRCWCAAALAAASRHNSLWAGKTSHPSAADVGGSQGMRLPHGESCCGGTTGSAQPQAWLQQDHHCPSIILHPPDPLCYCLCTHCGPCSQEPALALGIPGAAGQRGQLAGHSFPMM